MKQDENKTHERLDPRSRVGETENRNEMRKEQTFSARTQRALRFIYLFILHMIRFTILPQ